MKKNQKNKQKQEKPEEEIVRIFEFYINNP